MVWTWQYGPWNQGPAGELADAKNKTLTVPIDDIPTVSFDLDSSSRHFPQIIPMVTDIWVVQDGDDCPFRGRATARSGTVAKAKATRTQTAVGYKALVQTTEVNPAGYNVYTLDDPSDAAWEQVQFSEQLANSNLIGIVRGPRHPSTVRTFGLSFYQSLSDALDLCAKQANATWDITPLTIDEQQFDFWPAGSRGTDRGIIIDLGGRAVSASDEVAVDGYGNNFTSIGPPTDGSVDDSGGLGNFGWIETARVSDLGTRPEGRWTRIVSSNQTLQPAVLAEAQANLATGQIVPITWTAELARGWWQGRNHLWVGDPFTWICKVPVYDEKGRFSHMAYDVEETHIVNQMTVDFSTSMVDPKVTIQFGAPAPTDRRRRLKVNQSLAALALRG